MSARIIIGSFGSYCDGLWQLLWHTDITSVKDLLNRETLRELFTGVFKSHTKNHLSGFEMGVFFSIFVMLQFWNLFNARYFRTKGSALQDTLDLFFNRKRFRESASLTLLMVAGIILLGQYFITNVAGAFFDVARLLRPGVDIAPHLLVLFILTSEIC